MRPTCAAISLSAILLVGCASGLTSPSVCIPKRDASGQIARSDAARREFMRLTGFPNGRPGYVVDHIIPLACCGPDTPANMQWQTTEAAKAKDRVERVGC